MRPSKLLSTIVLVALLPLVALDAAATGPQPIEARTAAALAGLLRSYDAASPAADERSARIRALVLRFYSGNGKRPAWGAGNRAMAPQVLRQLGDAEQYGLRASDYAVRAALPDAFEAAPDKLARFDVDLTAAALRFLSDLHSGRTTPDFKWYGGNRIPDDFDPVAALRAAIGEGAFGPAVSAAEPRSALYARVKQTLAQYRILEQTHRRLAPLPPLPGPGKRETAQHDAGAAALRQRLVLLGDLAQGANATDDGDDPALEAGVRNFQMRHGLAADGILGKATMAALAVPLAQRILQLELTLERLRWMPHLPPGPTIIVNVPSFRLWALDTNSRPSSIETEMRVIVGNAGRTPTPLLIAQLRYLEFNPAWNVPRSIEVQELIPKLARDPDLLRREDLELVPRHGGPDTANSSPLDSLRAGTMRLRQRPGPHNALGAVKFAMPNPLNIYLHATPATELFDRTRRDLSHGCIRLEHPEELALFALRHEAGWDRDSVRAAMEPGPTRTVMLSTPIPVVLLYASAITDREGRAFFLPDTYGLDQKLAGALAAQRNGPTP